MNDNLYAPKAEAQLDALELGADADLFDAVLDAIDLVFDKTAMAQRLSTAVNTEKHGVVFRLPVPGFPPYKVFWVSTGPRIEAVFPHP